MTLVSKSRLGPIIYFAASPTYSSPRRCDFNQPGLVESPTSVFAG